MPHLMVQHTQCTPNQLSNNTQQEQHLMSSSTQHLQNQLKLKRNTKTNIIRNNIHNFNIIIIISISNLYKKKSFRFKTKRKT